MADVPITLRRHFFTFAPLEAMIPLCPEDRDWAQPSIVHVRTFVQSLWLFPITSTSTVAARLSTSTTAREDTVMQEPSLELGILLELVRPAISQSQASF